MYQNKDSEEIKILNVENTMEKVIYMVESNAERKNRLKFEAQNKIKNSKVENINYINNCGSLFIKDFQIRYLKMEDIIKPQLCTFKPLPENINPFLAEKFDLSQRRFIDLKTINTENDNFYSIFSLDNM